MKRRLKLRIWLRRHQAILFITAGILAIISTPFFGFAVAIWYLY